jgi:hypothetical protein
MNMLRSFGLELGQMLRRRFGRISSAANAKRAYTLIVTGETALLPQFAATIAAQAGIATDCGQHEHPVGEIIMAV